MRTFMATGLANWFLRLQLFLALGGFVGTLGASITPLILVEWPRGFALGRRSIVVVSCSAFSTEYFGGCHCE